MIDIFENERFKMFAKFKFEIRHDYRELQTINAQLQTKFCFLFFLFFQNKICTDCNLCITDFSSINDYPCTPGRVTAGSMTITLT